MVKWLQVVIGGKSSVASSPATDRSEGVSCEREGKLIDVPHEALSDDAERQLVELTGLVNSGWPTVKREHVKRRVQEKVWKVVSDTFHLSDDEMVEEITERIVDAAEADPIYEKMFDTKETE